MCCWGCPHRGCFYKWPPTTLPWRNQPSRTLSFICNPSSHTLYFSLEVDTQIRIFGYMAKVQPVLWVKPMSQPVGCHSMASYSGYTGARCAGFCCQTQFYHQVSYGDFSWDFSLQCSVVYFKSVWDFLKFLVLQRLLCTSHYGFINLHAFLSFCIWNKSGKLCQFQIAILNTYFESLLPTRLKKPQMPTTDLDSLPHYLFLPSTNWTVEIRSVVTCTPG